MFVLKFFSVEVRILYNFYLRLTKTDNDVTLTYIKKYRINVHLTWTVEVKGSKCIGNLWTERLGRNPTEKPR